MRQVGILAAAGVYALDHHLTRLRDDHANAARLAQRLAQSPRVVLDPGTVQTNIVIFQVTADAPDAATIVTRAREQGVLLFAFGPRTLRARHPRRRVDGPVRSGRGGAHGHLRKLKAQGSRLRAPGYSSLGSRKPEAVRVQSRLLTEGRHMKRWYALALAVGIGLGTTAVAQHKAEQRDMALVGYNDLQARSAVPADHPSTREPLDRLHRASRWRSAQSHHRRWTKATGRRLST